MNDTITLGSILGILTVVVGVVGLLVHARKMRRENEADARARTDEIKSEVAKHNDTIERRMTAQETKSADFMPRSEIEAKIEHEKANRIMANDAMRRVAEKHDEAIAAIRIETGRITERLASTASDMAEIKLLLKEQGRETRVAIEKLAEQIAHGGSR